MRNLPHIISQNASINICSAIKSWNTFKHELNPFSANMANNIKIWKISFTSSPYAQIVVQISEPNIRLLHCNQYLWWGRRNRTSKGSTTIGIKLPTPSSDSSGCHNTKGSIPGGKVTLSSTTSFSTTLGTLNLFITATNTGLEDPHGTNRFRAQSLRTSCSFPSL